MQVVTYKCCKQVFTIKSSNTVCYPAKGKRSAYSANLCIIVTRFINCFLFDFMLPGDILRCPGWWRCSRWTFLVVVWHQFHIILSVLSVCSRSSQVQKICVWTLKGPQMYYQERNWTPLSFKIWDLDPCKNEGQEPSRDTQTGSASISQLMAIKKLIVI